MKALLYSGALAIAAFTAKAMMHASPKARKRCRQDQKLRDELDEQQIDKMVMDSFPASDPPSTY